MGIVDLDFKPSVPVFDANVALGRRHDRRVKVDNPDDLLVEMKKVGVEKALVYSPHATTFDSHIGNGDLMEMVEGHEVLVPQFLCNPVFDEFDEFTAQVDELGVRALRMTPTLHLYPFQNWTVGKWLDWAASQGIPIWLPASTEFLWERTDVDPGDVYDVAAAHPDLNLVLTEVHYRHGGWALPLLKSLPNIYIDLSWWYMTDGVATLLESIGEERVLFGSRFPEAPMAPMLYDLHRNGLSEATLAAICSGNLERLLRA